MTTIDPMNENVIPVKTGIQKGLSLKIVLRIAQFRQYLYSCMVKSENILPPHPSPLPCLRRSGFAQAGLRGEGKGEGEFQIY